MFLIICQVADFLISDADQTQAFALGSFVGKKNTELFNEGSHYFVVELAGRRFHVVEVKHYQAVKPGMLLVAPHSGFTFIIFGITFVEMFFNITGHEHKHGKLPLDGIGLLPVTGLFSGTDLTDDISILTVGDYFVEDVDCAR